MQAGTVRSYRATGSREMAIGHDLLEIIHRSPNRDVVAILVHCRFATS